MSDIDIGYSLDSSDYLAGVGSIEAANQRLQGSFGQTVTSAGGVSRALNMVTPGRATIAGMTLLSSAAAAAQQNLSGLAATSSVTGISVDKLAGSIRTMSRDMPLGATATRQTVEQFTRLGVAGEGTERKISSLAKSVLQLSGATGEGPAQLASGMTDLARATGNTALDPTRFKAIGDSLTTISAKSGASATGILSFSKSIAPMAQASGIGATGIIGISSAFARLGEDGLGASTAVNKMLTDMNRAVRDGSPEMKTYASLVGKTTSEFERLFKSNPAEALTQVTEAIAKAGPSGPRTLEKLGIEGVRGQRSIQALVSSGGLRPAIAEATAAYGSGSTDKAAAAAFGGLTDSLSELGEATKQVAEAFGAPLLGPLTAVTNALKGVTGGAAKVLNSGPAQTLMTAAAWGGAGALAIKSLTSAGLTGAVVRQMFTAGPPRSLAAGIAAGSGMGANTRTARYGAPAAAAMRAGTLGQGFMGGTRSWLYNFGTGLGQTNPSTPGGPTNRMSMLRGYAVNAAATGAGMTANQFRNASVPMMDRRSSWGVSGGFKAGWSDARAAASAAPGAGVGAGFKAFNASMVTAGGSLRMLGTASGASAVALRDMTRFAGTVAKDGLKGAGMAAGKIGGFFGPQMALVAGVAAVGVGISRRNKEIEDNKNWLQEDIGKSINTYRESIGKATEATKSYGSVADQMFTDLAKTAENLDYGQVKKVTEDDKTAADGTKGKISTRYSGNSDQIAAQVMAQSPSGVTPEELQAIKVDLLRQFGSDVVGDVMGKLPDVFEKKDDGTGGLSTKALTDSLTKVGGNIGGTDQGSKGAGILNGILTGLAGGAVYQANTLNSLSGSDFSGLQTASKLPGVANMISPLAGGGWHQSTLSKDQQSSIDAMTQGVAQQYTDNSRKYEGKYAAQQQIKDINTSIKAVYETGNEDALQQIMTKYGEALGGEEYANKIWSPDELKANGFDFSKQVGGTDKTFGDRRSELEGEGAAFSGDGGIMPVARSQIYTGQIRPQSGFLSEIFDPKNQSVAAKAMTQAVLLPGNAGLQEDAMGAVVDAADKAGLSMEALAVQSAKAANAVGLSSDAYAALRQTQQRAEFEMNVRNTATGATPSDIAKQKTALYSGLASMRPDSPEALAEVNRGKAGLLAVADEGRARMVARLQVARQSEISTGRAREDFDLSKKYSGQDFDRQSFRMNRNYNIQTTRSTEAFGRQQDNAKEDFATSRARQQRDFNISAARAEEDYQKSRFRTMRDFNTSTQRAEADYLTNRIRTIRDFNISAQRAEADYLKNRGRAIRDFNIGLKRQIEDAAKTMLDPYSRIQTKATWDAQNLMVNLRQQTEAFTKQKAQLDQLRKAGLSAQAIDVLGLGKAENAQQVNNLASDAMKDPSSLSQLNKATADRSAAAGALYTDDSNTELKRQREDFSKSMKDQEDDYRTSVKRSRADLAKSLADQAKDFAKSMLRSRKDMQKSLKDQQIDFLASVRRSRDDLVKSMRDSSDDFHKSMRRARKEFAIGLANAKADLGMSLADMAKDRDRAMARQKKALDTNLSRMAQDIAEADRIISGNMSDLAEQTNRAIHGKAVQWQKIMKDDTKSWVKVMQADVIPQLAKTFGQMGLTVKDITNTTGKSTGGGTWTKGGQTAFADGGSVRGSSPHDRADDVDAKLTSGEFVQPVKAVRHYGSDFMRKVQTMQFPKEVALRLADGGMVYKQMMAWSKKNLPGVAITSTYRPGAITATGVVSNHALGKAIDLAPSMATFNKILGAFGGKNILQLLYSPADGRTIDHGRPYRMSAITKGDHWNHVHWAMNAMTGGAGAAALGEAMGVDPKVLASIFSKAPRKGAIQNALTDKVYAALMKKLAAVSTNASGAGGVSGGAFTGSEDTSRWSGDVNKVLTMLHRPSGDAGAVLRRIQFESGGNPRAINNWDSNAKAGTPSKGLMQVIDPTFKAYRGRSLPDNIWDPKANIYAGSNYAIKRYGSLSAIDPKNRPKGYDSGGWMEPGKGEHENATGKPEAVLTNEQWKDISTLADKVGQMVTRDDLQGVNAANGAHITVNNHQRYHYDSSADFDGASFTLQGIENPRELLDALQKIQTTNRSTQTRGVRRST